MMETLSLSSMKSCKRFLFWALLPLLAACSTVPGQPEEDGQDAGYVTLTATTESGQETRTVLDGDYTHVLWMPHESISVFRGGKMAKFTSGNEEPAARADFQGTLPGTGAADECIYGLYPYNPEAQFEGGVITTSLPDLQVGKAGSFESELFLSTGCTSGREIAFKNACSGIRFMLDRDDIRRVTFLSNGGEALAGRMAIRTEGEEPVIGTLKGEPSEVTLEAPSNGTFAPAVWYYLVTAPAILEKGYTLLLEGDSVQGTLRSSEAITLHRNKFRSASLDASRVDFIPRSDYDIENPGVRSFLENVDYTDDPDYTRFEVSNYPGTDKPNPVKISWVGKASVIRMSTAPDLSEAWDMAVDDSPASVYNLTPGVRYFYSVLAADGTVLKESCVVPEGPLRMINGLLKNSRDLGGWKAGDKTIRYGLVYRGANLDDIQSNPSKKDIVVRVLHVDVDLDLRGLPPGSAGGSGEKNPWTEADPVLYKNIQLWNYFIPSGFTYQIPETVPGESADQYQYAIRCIIGWLKEGKVVYFHCHGGADRTGTLAFLLEGLLGVSESDMAKDFELTTYSNSTHRRNSVGGWFYKPMVQYIRSFAPGKTIEEQVTAWAKTRHSEDMDPLTDQEIQDLKELLLE